MLEWLRCKLGIGKWKLFLTDIDLILCSNCGYETGDAPRICPQCGAKMVRSRAVRTYLDE